MTKRNFKSHCLQHKNKWSENFHDFLRNALQKEPKRRPTAQELLKVRGREGGVRVGGWVKWKGWFMKVEECRGNRGQSVVCV